MNMGDKYADFYCIREDIYPIIQKNFGLNSVNVVDEKDEDTVKKSIVFSV